MKKTLGFLGLGVALFAFGCAWYIQQSFPALDGFVRVADLQEPLNIQRDTADLTHIKATNDHDLWFGIGYVHAQERSWQLEFNRRLMHGELSEVFGYATVDTDKLMRTLGIMQAAQRQWDGLPAEGKATLTAYAEGINAFHATSRQALPPEFHILRTQPGRWTPQDSVGWSLMMALDLGGNWGTEFARLSAAQTLSTERLWELLPPYGAERPVSKVDLSKLYADLEVYRQPVTTAMISGAAHAASTGTTGQNDLKNRIVAQTGANDLLSQIGNIEGKGSNNWVVAGSHTVSGKPLLANDPHLGLGAPAIWYFASLQAPGINVVGATLPGIPYVVLGRTDKVAWGVTNTGPDVQDLYLEQINPDNPAQYRAPNIKGKTAWETFKVRQEIIKVKGEADLALTVRTSRHGPVLSDAQSSHTQLLDLSRYVLALRWSALDADNLTVMSGIAAARAQSVADLKLAYKTFHSPMQNLVMADVEGNIAYQAVGKVPLRRADNDILGLAPSPGWEARYDWAGWVPLAENPQDDGQKGWIATANQRITAPGYKHFLGQDYALPFRFDRIEALLAATPKHDLTSMASIQADVQSSAAARLLPVLRKAQSTHPLSAQAMAQMQPFEGNMQAQAAAPLIFATWVDELARSLVSPKVGEDKFKALYGKRHFRHSVELALLGKDNWWCAPKRCEDHVDAAWNVALDRLQLAYGSDVSQWQWGRAHPALSSHRPFSNVPALARFFEVESPTGGDPFTVNVGQYWPNENSKPFANRHAASMRTLFDLSDLEKSRFVYQTGQSGLVFSARYRDMAEPWRAGQTRPLQLKPATVAHSLTLMP